MLSLTDFLMARIAEDEELAHAATKYDLITVESSTQAEEDHARRHDPARVLAECEAKRRIVERCSAVDYAMPSTHLAHGILNELAAVYADHEDCDPEWRP